ncbi:MAG: GDSL-type esterase/lipase family protein [Bacteroidota bacterium]
MRRKAGIAAFVVMLFCVMEVTAQTNPGFEKGLTGWIKTGKSAAVSVNDNAHGGKACAKLSAGPAGIMQRIKVGQLSVLSFNCFVSVSDTTTKATAFVRFFDEDAKLLLTYKSAPVNSIKYTSTGNYTETPANTSYMEIGVEHTSGNGSVYVDDFTIDINVGKPKVKHATTANLNQYMRPFWKSDTIYNETVLLFSKDGKPADGKLLYMPSKILSVKNFALTITFKQGVDYTIDGNVITMLQGSKMPFRADTSFDTKKDLAWYNLQSQWVVVTYTHTDKWDGPAPVYKGDKMPRVLAKLKRKKAVKIVALGMSITRGMDVSSYDTVAPYMPTYVDLFARQLKKAYNYGNITMYNAGLPGAVVDWGAQYCDKYITPLRPDLIILDFGMNDFWRYTPEQFKGFIETIIKRERAGCPNAEFLLISNMKFDPDYVLDSDRYKGFYVGNLQGYSEVLKQMEGEGIINLDMTEISDAIYRHKKAKDCIVNPLHPNDYMARWYAQGLAALLIK